MAVFNLHAAQFILSASQPSEFVHDQGAEIAFGGRSNSGKSTAINTLCGRKSLARTSKTPGRTQLINFFAIGDDVRLVDFPGYGFAKSDHKKRQHWSRLIEQYYLQRSSLAGTMLMMDIRHPLKDSDEQMLRWCEHCQSPVHVLLTKSDKLSRNQASKQLMIVRKAATQYDRVTVQLFSGLRREGVEEALEKIEQWVTEKTNPGV